MTDLDAEATQILDTCTRETAPALVAWAFGIRVLGHAMHFYQLPPVARRVSPAMCGGSIGAGDRMYEATAHRASVYSGDGAGGRAVHASVTWEQVCALVTAVRVGPDLHGRIVAALDRRRALVAPYRSNWTEPTDEDLAREREFDEVEQLCADLGDEVWDVCRPTRLEQTVQLDLLEGLL